MGSSSCAGPREANKNPGDHTWKPSRLCGNSPTHAPMADTESLWDPRWPCSPDIAAAPSILCWAQSVPGSGSHPSVEEQREDSPACEAREPGQVRDLPAEREQAADA